MDHMSQTGNTVSRSRNWRLVNSWWILLTFTAILTPFAFFYIGAKAKKRLWLFLGFLFTILMGVWLYLSDYEEGTTAYEIGFDIFGVVYLGGIILAFMFRKEYLLRLDMLDNAKAKAMEEYAMRERLAGEFLKKGIYVPTGTPHTVNNLEDELVRVKAQNKPEPAKEVGDSLDINSCSAEELSALPGISLILAKKAINYRQENGGFKSKDEFFEVVGLKPHFIVQVSEKIVCKTTVKETAPINNGRIGRQLDL